MGDIRRDALIDAMRSRNVEAARSEIAAGASLDATSRSRLVPDFMDAIESDAGLAVSLFLELGMDVNARDDEGWSPLHYAACNPKGAKLVRELLAKGADVNARDGEGRTPLHHAAASLLTGEETVRILLEHGADVTAVCHCGRAVLHDASRGGKVWFVTELIDEHGDTPTLMNRTNDAQAIHYAASGHQRPVIEFLLGRGVPIGVPDGDGRTALHYAAADGDADMVRFLVESGAEVNGASHGGETPLYDAAETGRTAAVRALLELGADPELATVDGKRPRDVAQNDDIRSLLDSRG